MYKIDGEVTPFDTQRAGVPQHMRCRDCGLSEGSHMLGCVRRRHNAGPSGPPVPIKVIAVGRGGVGKTSLLIRYTTNSFPVEYVPTVFDNYSVVVEHSKYHDALESVHLGLWDTGGGEDYARLRPLSYPQTDLFLLCVSVVPMCDWRIGGETDVENIHKEWMPELTHHAFGVPIILVGTRRDLRCDDEALQQARDHKLPVVTFENGVALAKEIGAVSYLECSAKTGEGVNEIFDEVIEYLLTKGAGARRRRAGAERCVLQ